MNGSGPWSLLEGQNLTPSLEASFEIPVEKPGHSDDSPGRCRYFEIQGYLIRIKRVRNA